MDESSGSARPQQSPPPAATYEFEPDTEIPELFGDVDDLPFAPPQLHKSAIRLCPIVESLRIKPMVASSAAKLSDLRRPTLSTTRTGMRALADRISARAVKEFRLGRYELRETWNDMARVTRAWRWRRQGVRVGQDALARYRELGDHRRQALELNGLARIYRARGEFQEAIVCCTQALTIFNRLGNRRGECLSLSNLGLAHEAQGNRAKAVRCYEEALEIARILKDRQIEGQILANLGTAYNRQGRPGEAHRLWEQALGLLRPGTSAHRQLSQHLG